MDDLLLQKYLRNETSEEELVEVLDWLDASAENQRYLDRLDYISNLNILAGEAQPRVRRRTVSLWKRAAQWSAGAAAVLLVCAGLSHYLADRVLEHRAQDMMAITAPNGQSMSVTLSDGTRVWLNSGAKLEYPSIFSRKTRRVKISGEAMFEVEHDAARPFIVETFACDAEVLGTKFNILADARTADFSAALLEGRLKISNRLIGGESFILSPNEQIDLVDRHLKLNRITDPDDFRWVDGLMNLNTLSFGEVIRKFESYYGVRITIDNPEDIPELKYHGKIRVSDGVDHALKLLQITNNFAYTRDKNPHVERGEIDLTAYAKRGTKIEMQVEAQTDGVISVPLFGYDGYRAQADGQELETGLDENKRLTVVVPAGTKGEVKLWYAGKRWWRISDAVSLLAALALIAARIQHRRKAQKA